MGSERDERVTVTVVVVCIHAAVCWRPCVTDLCPKQSRLNLLKAGRWFAIFGKSSASTARPEKESHSHIVHNKIPYAFFALPKIFLCSCNFGHAGVGTAWAGLLGSLPGRAQHVSVFCKLHFACLFGESVLAEVALSREMLLGSPSPLRRAGERRRVL